MLISTKPKSKGQEAALYRSRQLTEFRWTPVGDIPVYIKTVGKTKLDAGQEQLGMIYSSTEPTDKFITENISFETMLSIIANPDSALYHKDLNGHNNSWAYFGIVCNGLVRYAMNINRRYSTKRWPTVPGMRKIADKGAYTAEQLELCDVLYAYGEGRNHVAMITDLLRDEEGVIRKIEVSEAIRPTCTRHQFDVDDFFEKHSLYSIWRYDFLDQVPMPDPWQDACLRRGVPGLPVIALDCGNKTNYRTNEDVEISVFPEGVNEVEICCGEEVVERLTLDGRCKVTRRFPRGYYTVTHKNTGEMVEFCVTEPKIEFTVDNGMLTVRADACDPQSRISHLDFREMSRKERELANLTDPANIPVAYYSTTCAPLARLEELTEEEKRTGVFTRPIPEDAVHIKVTFENKYGMWTHTMIRIK